MTLQTRGTVPLSVAPIGLRRVVNEIIVVFLGTLPLDRHPASDDFYLTHYLVVEK
jgi:hypothetical protein